MRRDLAAAGLGPKRRVSKPEARCAKLRCIMPRALLREMDMIYTLGDRKLATVGDDYYIAPGAQIIGSVSLGRSATVWFNCVLRADSDRIVVGDGTNIQDGSIIHVDEGFPVHIGNNVTLG